MKTIITATILAFLATTSYATTITPSGNTVTVAVTTGPKGDTGPIGPQGIQGPAGPQGSAGPAGPQGPQGVAGLSLNWRGDWAGSPTGYVNNDAVYRNGSSYRAINYSSGVDPASDTTYVHWYPVSIKGATGATGAAGATGATGPAGPQGAKGDKGDIGATGPAGAQGPQGIQGPTGATGAPGATGATGATGPTGPAGPKGDKGDTGAAGAGVPAGGTTGQVLSKINGTDYNTQWVNQSGGLPTDSPTVTTKITAPLFESNASDGTHYIKPYNSTAYSGTCTKGMVQTVGTPAVLQVCTADGTWAAAGTGGSGSGTVNNSSNAYHIAGYAATGTTVSDTGITYSADGTTITTAQGTAPDALTLRPGSANGTSGVTLLGPSGATTAYSLQFPTAAPTAGQIPVFGTPASGIVPVTWGSGGGGGGSGTVTQIIAASPLTGGTITSSGTIGISQASGSVSGYLSSTDWTTFNGKAPLASPTFTGTVTLPITGSGNQCVRVSSAGVVSGTGSDCGTGTGGGSGTVNNSSNAYRLAGYAATGTTVSDSGITYASDGSTITTAKVAGSADAQLFRAAADLTGAGIMGPSASTTTPYYLQLPATPPTNGQVAIFGTSASGTVNGVTANIIPVTYGTNGSGGSMVYPGAGVPVSTGSAWGSSLNITAISDSTGTTSSTTAASSTAVKAAYDLAATKGTGTVTGVSVATANGVSGSSSGGATPALTIILGAITPTSVTASGLIDGTAPTALTTVNDYVLGSTYKTNYTFNNYATAPQTIVYRLPAPASGRTECVRNYTGKTNVLQVQALASTYIDMDGVVSASTGYVSSGGALGDAACFVGVDATHWVMYAGKGAWTLH